MADLFAESTQVAENHPKYARNALRISRTISGILRTKKKYFTAAASWFVESVFVAVTNILLLQLKLSLLLQENVLFPERRISKKKNSSIKCGKLIEEKYRHL